MSISKNHKGFTIGEMITTVAIVGVLTAVAIPNFLRMKMNVNMELVKQNLKVIGQNMNDLLNKNGQFPQDILQLGSSSEELAITANLNAIDKRDYTTDGYQTFTNRTSYQLRTCPKEGQWGIAGDQCFILDPSGIRTIERWDGTGMAMNLVGQAGMFMNFTKYFEQLPYYLALEQLNKQNLCQSKGGANCSAITANPPSTLLYFPAALNLDKLLPQTYSPLESKGIYFYQREQTPNRILEETNNFITTGTTTTKASYYWGLTQNLRGGKNNFGTDGESSNLKLIEVGFVFKNPMTFAELQKKIKSIWK